MAAPKKYSGSSIGVPFVVVVTFAVTCTVEATGLAWLKFRIVLAVPPVTPVGPTYRFRIISSDTKSNRRPLMITFLAPVRKCTLRGVPATIGSASGQVWRVKNCRPFFTLASLYPWDSSARSPL
ncbi:hypothetical protein D9M71_554440 [compost metagenome]